MTEQQHPITPPPELVQEWVAEIWHEGTPVRVALSDTHIATRAAQWGADQELEACCIQLADKDWYDGIKNLRNQFRAAELRAARRPKPPSLKEQALADLDKIESSDRGGYAVADLTAIRRALEALDD